LHPASSLVALALLMGLLRWIVGRPLVTVLGRLPGDLYVHTGSVRVFAPMATSALAMAAVHVLVAAYACAFT
jgi:hypothetical protein